MAAKALTLTKLDMDEALASGQIQLAYQPIFSLTDGSVVRVEALVRWEHPRLGTMLPAVFLPAFEAEDRLSALTRRVLERASAEFGSWAYRKPSGLSVNLSPLDMVDEQLPTVLKAVIDSAGIEAEQITLECPTTGVNAEAARPILIAIKKLGVRLAAEIMRAPECVADAFDLAPFDEVKTSGRGLLRAARNNHSATLTGAADLLTYADAKGAVVTAIGAEDAAACLALKTVGFQQVQANVLAPALPIDAVTPRVTNSALEMLGFGSQEVKEAQEAQNAPIAEMSAFYQQRRRAQGEMLRRAAEQRVAQESEAALLSEKGIRAVQDVLAESYAEAPESSQVTTTDSSGDQEATVEAQSKAGLLMRPDLASASLGYGASKLRSAPRARIKDTRQHVAKAISDVLESLPAEVSDREGTEPKIEHPDDVLDA
ncbi:MAG: EAL domain-containing protein, partial [Parvularculaceae bacterium]|nr:EAL domain-containing protein [Parvularculaceae bacterium]